MEHILMNRVLYVDLAHDGLQTFDSNSRKSTNILWVRAKNVPLDVYNRNANLRVLAVADKKSNYAEIYKYLFKQLSTLQPGYEGLWYTTTSAVSETGLQYHQCWVIVVGIFGDMPARKMITNSLGATSYLGCDYCVFHGH